MNRTLTLLLFVVLGVACTFVQKVKDGTTAFDRKQYSVAIPMLEKEYNKANSRIEKGKLAYMLAESYRSTSQNKASIPWYLTAYENSYGVDALKYYAFALKQEEQYAEAMKAFKNLGIEIGSPYEYRREITACKQALDWNTENKNPAYSVDIARFNTSNAEYSPSMFQDGKLVITSDRNTSEGEDTYNWTGNNFSDLFLVNPASNDISPFEESINTVDNEGTVSFTSDFREMYFTRCSNPDKYADTYCAIMVCNYEGASWSNPVEVKLFEEDNVNYGDPAITKDGSRLYFSANHPEGWGGHDIYQVDRTPDGWGEPQLLGRTVNSPGNERFPFIDRDTLYFSSDYLTGMGGLDIFRTYQMESRVWSPAQNLKAPVNSGSDDFGYVIDYAAQKDPKVIHKGYFTSNRSGGKGSDDIYAFIEKVPPPPPPIDTTKPIVYKMILEGFVLEKIYKENNNPNSAILGRKPLDGATVDIKYGGQKKQVTVGEDGFFSLELDKNTDYSFQASKAEYLNNNTTFSTKGIGQDPNNPVQTFTVEIELDKIFRNMEITLEDIYYDFDRYEIRDDAKPSLNKLARILTENPTIRIQLSSHTDCQGGAKYNETLSQRRAESAVEYLINQGIDTERLTAKGYGEYSLAIDCACTRCTDEEHQFNRRTTFKIVE